MTQVKEFAHGAEPSVPRLYLRQEAVLAVLGALPFIGLVAHHVASGGGTATGFIQSDMPYYSANGRAAFERGDSVCYPNAYDPDASSPPVYFHWFVWLLGFGIVKLGLDPGFQFVVLGTTSAVLCAWVTLRLVRAAVPTPRFLGLLYLGTMWGGGLFCVAAALSNAASGLPLGRDLLRDDPAGGDWCLNWGRNLIYATEATYHLLMASCWLAVLERRWLAAFGAGVAVAATQPFTGLQALLILGAWAGFRFAAWPSVRRLGRVLGVSLALVAFAAYYGFYLECFPQHRVLRQEWSLDWSLTARQEVLAYGLVGSLALCRLAADKCRIGRSGWFLLTALAVSFALINHDRIMRPRQPLHFTRGYVWLPLWLLALPLAQRLLARSRTRAAPFVLSAVVLAGTLLLADNATFLAVRWRSSDGFYLTAAERDMFSRVGRLGLRGVLLCPDGKLSYLAAAYTPLRPYCGHSFLTPDYARRVAEIEALFNRGDGGQWLDAIDYVLVPAPAEARTKGLLQSRGAAWQIVTNNDEWVLLGRAGRDVKGGEAAP